MFFAAIVGPGERLSRAREVLALHGKSLLDTGWAGSLVEEPFTGGVLAWDGASSHAELLRDQDTGTVLLRGGYLAADDAWGTDGRHTTEHGDVWGEFAAVTVRPGPGDVVELDAFADPAASWPVYHGHRDDTLVVSNDPHFVALALGLTELSAQGVFEVLAYQHSLGVETTIAGVERLFPGVRLHAKATTKGIDQIAIESHPVYTYVSTDAPQEVLEREALAALRQGVSDIRPLANGEFAAATLQVSGGLDSRLTVAVLSEVFAERPDVVTFDLSNEAELTIAREVAARLGFPHRTATLADADLETMRIGWLLTGGQVSPYAAAGNVVSYEVGPRNAAGRVLIVGAWPGDCLIGSYIPLVPGMAAAALRGPRVRRWAAKRGQDRTGPDGGVSGPGARRAERAARQRLRQRLFEGSGSTAAQLISYWAMFGRQPTFSYVHPAMLTSHVLPITPVLARPYLHQLLRLSGQQILGKNFYRAMIAHGFPSLAGIPNASTGRPVTDEPATIRWLPASIDQLYTALPIVVQRLAHATVGRVRRRNGGPESSVEADHWSTVLAEGGHSDTIVAGDIVVTAKPGSDIHLRAVARGLRWTVDYLEDGVALLGCW